MKKFVLCALAILILFSVPLTAAAEGTSAEFPIPGVSAEMPDGFAASDPEAGDTVWAESADGSAKIILHTETDAAAMFEVGLGGYQTDFREMTQEEFDQVVEDMYVAPHYFDVLGAAEYEGSERFVTAEATSGNQSFIYYRTLKDKIFYLITYKVTDRALEDADREAARSVAASLTLSDEASSYAASILAEKNAFLPGSDVTLTLPNTQCMLRIPGNFYGVDRVSSPAAHTPQANHLLEKMQALMRSMDIYYYALGVMESGRAVQMAVTSSGFDGNAMEFLQIGQIHLYNDPTLMHSQGEPSDYGVLEADDLLLRRALYHPQSDRRYYCMSYATDESSAAILFAWDRRSLPSAAEIEEADAVAASLSFLKPATLSPDDAQSMPNETRRVPVTAQSEKLSLDLLPYLVSILFVIAVFVAVLFFYVKNRRIAAVSVSSLSEDERLARLIKRLDELKCHFIITEEEFQKKRNELLDRKQR